MNDDDDLDPKVLNSTISPPIFVDSRKSARDSHILMVTFIILKPIIKFVCRKRNSIRSSSRSTLKIWTRCSSKGKTRRKTTSKSRFQMTLKDCSTIWLPPISGIKSSTRYSCALNSRSALNSFTITPPPIWTTEWTSS